MNILKTRDCPVANSFVPSKRPFRISRIAANWAEIATHFPLATHARKRDLCIICLHMLRVAPLLSARNQISSPWAVRGILLAAASALVWTIVDGLRTGWIRAVRGIWHRSVNRDHNPAEFWLAVMGNGAGCIVVLGILVASFVIPHFLPASGG